MIYKKRHMTEVNIAKFDISIVSAIIGIVLLVSIYILSRILPDSIFGKLDVITFLITVFGLVLIYFLSWNINFYFRNVSFFKEHNQLYSRFYIDRVPYKKKEIIKVEDRLVSFIKKKNFSNNTWEIKKTHLLDNKLSKIISIKFLFDNQFEEVEEKENQYTILVTRDFVNNPDFADYQGVNGIIFQDGEAIKMRLEIKVGNIYDQINDLWILRLLNKIFGKGDKILLINEAIFVCDTIAYRIGY